jgi:hypothetical protein
VSVKNGSPVPSSETPKSQICRCKNQEQVESQSDGSSRGCAPSDKTRQDRTDGIKVDVLVRIEILPRIIYVGNTHTPWL